MANEAKLKEAESGGLVPDGDGWFVLNARDARWWHHDTFGSSVTFEGEDARFPQFGINIQVIEPGQPNCMYHGENAQEDFLVLSGECLLLVDGEERPLKQWDFVHSPAWTEHVFVGAGDGPCAILMVGARPEHEELRLPGRRRRAEARRRRRARDVVGERGVRAVRAADARAVPRGDAAGLRLELEAEPRRERLELGAHGLRHRAREANVLVDRVHLEHRALAVGRRRRPCRRAGRRGAPATRSSPTAASPPACTSRACTRSRTAAARARGRRRAGRTARAARSDLRSPAVHVTAELRRIDAPFAGDALDRRGHTGVADVDRLERHDRALRARDAERPETALVLDARGLLD